MSNYKLQHHFLYKVHTKIVLLSDFTYFIEEKNYFARLNFQLQSVQYARTYWCPQSGHKFKGQLE